MQNKPSVKLTCVTKPSKNNTKVEYNLSVKQNQRNKQKTSVEQTVVERHLCRTLLILNNI